jgi:serine/threonine protein phosphatase 1
MRRLVVGDIHGAYRALIQVLGRADFNPKEDLLIGLGDYTDRWPDSFEVIEYLNNLPNFLGVLGNHDDWFLDYFQTGRAQDIWVTQGGSETIKSYKRFMPAPPSIDHSHFKFLSNLHYYVIIEDKLFVHGGLYLTKEGVSIKEQTNLDLLWDRTLFTKVTDYLRYHTRKGYGNPHVNIEPFKEVYLGHTTTQLAAPDFKPINALGVYMLDQGGGWDGKLTVMDIDTKEYWQSDFTPELYSDFLSAEREEYLMKF